MHRLQASTYTSTHSIAQNRNTGSHLLLYNYYIIHHSLNGLAYVKYMQ